MNERGVRLIAKLAHKGQKYGNDDYYQAHVRPLVEMVRVAGGNKHAINAAYLHDVIEDTEVTLDDLIYVGIDMEVAYTLKAITKLPDEEYMEYINRVRTNKNAVLIKRLDIQLNLSNKPSQSLAKRYRKALDLLNG